MTKIKNKYLKILIVEQNRQLIRTILIVGIEIKIDKKYKSIFMNLIV